MEKIVALFICLLVSVVSFGQDKNVSTSATPEIPPGPSMKETEAWIKRDSKAIGSDYQVTQYKGTTWGTTYNVATSVLSECRLTVRQVQQLDNSANQQSITSVILMNVVDISKLKLMELPVGADTIYDKPRFLISVFALLESGEPFSYETDGFAGGKTKKFAKVTSFSVFDREKGETALFVIRRAAILCGAPNPLTVLSGDDLVKISGKYYRKGKNSLTDHIELRPDGTVLVKLDGESMEGKFKVKGDRLAMTSPGEGEITGYILGNTIRNDNGVVLWEKRPEPIKPAETGGTKTSPGQAPSPAASTITNTEVIQLVAAGLSEQVIITSIRQASYKNFNLTPTGLISLKKANVPDGVIAFMQDNNSPVQGPTGIEAKKTPKYDPSLSLPKKPPIDNGCSGIETMGIYRQTVLSGEVGGGLEEWLAKIRNNTAITKIVTYSWRDMYGQTPKAQVQIRGGDIATTRLDLTQARVIAPVTNLQLVSCQ